MVRSRWCDMAGQVQTIPLGVQDSAGVRSVGKISPNTRVKASTGFVGTVADTILFPGPPTSSVTGQWVVPNQRCLVNGIPTISVSSVGIAFAATVPPGSTGPMVVVQPDPRVSAF